MVIPKAVVATWTVIVATATTMIAAPSIISMLGFGAAGVAKGSVAAGVQSGIGGAVASGSLFSTMQSVGAAGLGMAGKAVAGIVGFVGSAAAVRKFFGFR